MPAPPEFQYHGTTEIILGATGARCTSRRKRRCPPKGPRSTPTPVSSVPTTATRRRATRAGAGRRLRSRSVRARLPKGARVLEVGTGTGYQTAVLARIATEVWTVERDPVLAREAEGRLDDLGVRNVRLRVGDGSLGWEEGSPYQGILVTAGAPDIPPSLVEQLAPGGCLVIPIGSHDRQRLVRVTLKSDGTSSARETLMECRFRPVDRS